MNMHRPLVRSSVLAAVAGAVLPVGAANAATTLYATQSSFDSAAVGAGLDALPVETFEENTMTGAYAVLGSSISSGVPNGPFPNGLDTPDLMIRASFGSVFALKPEPAYWPNITSTVVGTNSESDRTIVECTGGNARAIGMVITGIQSFTTNYPTDVEYDIYDTSGTLIATGSWPTPTSETGAFFGVVSDDPIGSISLRGVRFGLDQQEYVDDVAVWTEVPGVIGDTNGDGVVDVTDLLAVLAAWGLPCDGCPEDVDGDNDVDVNDLLDVLANWS
jgi:hypothetical protein